MLTLRSLLSLPVFLSTTIIAHALAAPGGFIDLNGDKGRGPLAAQLTGGEDCNDKQIEAIREGFADMNQLFQAAVNMSWDGAPERDFFGPLERIQNYTSMIESNILRASQYSNLAGSMTRNPDIHVRCDDPNDFCDEGNRKDGKHVAYNIRNEPHVNFCRRYFGLDPLEKTVDQVADNATVNLQIMSYYNRATAWARQVMHISAVGTAIIERVDRNGKLDTGRQAAMTTMQTAPLNTSYLAGVMNERPETESPNDIETFKYAYGATRAKLLAILSTQEPYDAANNAESYALYALARYVMAKKDFYPNMPVIDITTEASVLADNELQDGERPRYACFDASDVVSQDEQTSSLGRPLTSSGSPRAGMPSYWRGHHVTGRALSSLIVMSITFQCL